jgi:hypothetical protein
VDVFDDPKVIPSVQHIMNDHVSSETGYSPFELTFGSVDKIYNNLLSGEVKERTHVLLKRLNESLKVIREVSREYQLKLIDERNPSAKQVPQNLFQPGDFILFNKGGRTVPKMSAKFKGPYEVIGQTKNDVTCRNLVTGAIQYYSVVDLTLFFGTREQAYEAALRDQQQFVVDEVLSYSGNNCKRTEMTFKVKFMDGDIVDLPWSPDLLCEPFYEFCESKTYLKHLTLDTKMANLFMSHARKLDITTVNVGDVVYVDLRFFGDSWYESIGLPDWQTSSYVVEFKYLHWFHKNSKKKITACYVLGGNTYTWDNYHVYCWGTNKKFDDTTMTMVDTSYIKNYPKLVE